MTAETKPSVGTALDPFRNAKPPKNNLAHLYRGPSRPPMPTAVELGSRLRLLREDQNLSLAEAARRADLDEHVLSTFENTGRATAQDLLDMVAALSHSTSFDDAFNMPRFSDISEVIEHGRRTRP